MLTLARPERDTHGSWVPEPYRAAMALEVRLGDPSDPRIPFSFRSAVELDEVEAYPEAACATLDDWGLQEHYVPLSLGGRLASIEELVSLIRAVARRDLTVAVAHTKTLLGAVGVWLAGSVEQQQRLAALIQSGWQAALALTERAHGSDLLGGEVAAVAVPGGYRVNGEKWLINNATRSAALTLLARTGGAAGPRALSLFLVYKQGLDPAAYHHLPKVRTHGVRGADISGIRFDGLRLPAESLVGALGAGLETSLRGFQITRTLCGALSLGVADTALRTVLGFTRQRLLHGRPLCSVRHVRRTLVSAFADLLICDCVTLTAARGLHVAAEQQSVGSAVVKYFVPATVEAMLHRLARVLGARHYLREGHCAGIFQKLLRDHALVGLFDGSSVVNLRAIGLQLRRMAGMRVRGGFGNPGLARRVEQIFTLGTPLPPLDLSRLILDARGCDDVLNGLAASLDRLDRLSVEVPVRILGQAGEIRAGLAGLDAEVLAGSAMDDKSPELFALARRHCRLYAAAACLQVWIHSRGGLDPFFARGEWVSLCLDRLLSPAAGEENAGGDAWSAASEEAAEKLLALDRENRLFSILPLPLPHSARHDQPREEEEIVHATNA